MKTKFNLNTVILLLILLFLVGLSVVLLVWVRRLAQPLEEVEEAVERQIEQIINPTPTIIPDPVTIIHEMRSLSRLETASYTVEKIITAESGQGPLGFLFGDELILVAHGQVVAGVDLSDMSEDDVRVTDEGTVYLVLPEAEVFDASLDNEKTYVFRRDTGMIGQNQDLESEARLAAEQEIERAALEDGILEMAQQNAEVYMQRLILSLGFREVIFIEVLPTPAPTAAP